MTVAASVSFHPAAPLERGRAWWMVAVLFLFYVLAWLDRLIVSMLVEPIKASLALSDLQIGIVLGPSFAICYALFGLPLGWAADRWSRRHVIFAGVVIWALATTACGFVSTLEGLIVARVFVGVGEAALLPSAYSLIADAFPRERLTLATSTFQMAGKVGSATAFGIGGIAITAATAAGALALPFHGAIEPWQLVMMMVGLPGVLIAFLAFTFADPGRRTFAGDAGATGTGAALAFARDHARLIGLMLVAFSALAVCGYSMTAWVPTYVGRRFGWSPIEYGPALSVMNLLAAASLVVNGRVVDRLFARGMKDAHLRYYGWMIAVLLPVVLTMFFVGDAWVFLACYGVVQFITVPFMVYLSSVLALLAPATVRGQMIGLFMFVFTVLGMGVGPSLVGALTDLLFADEARLGSALAIVVGTASLIALAALRLALIDLAPAVRAREAQLSA